MRIHVLSVWRIQKSREDAGSQRLRPPSCIGKTTQNAFRIIYRGGRGGVQEGLELNTGITGPSQVSPEQRCPLDGGWAQVCYSVTTKTGATQTKLTNQITGKKQYKVKLFSCNLIGQLCLSGPSLCLPTLTPQA